MRNICFFLMLLLSLSLATQDDPRLKFQPIDDQHASVSAQDENVEGDIDIPSTVVINGKNYTVTAKANTLIEKSITTLTIPF